MTICFTKIEDELKNIYIIVFEQGKIKEPLCILDKFDVINLNKEINKK